MDEKKKRKLTVPHVYILLLAIMLICAVLTYLVPAGAYDMHTITVPETGAVREVVDAQTYHQVESTPVSLLQFLTAVPRGMQEAAQIIFFLFVICVKKPSHLYQSSFLSCWRWALTLSPVRLLFCAAAALAMQQRF